MLALTAPELLRVRVTKTFVSLRSRYMSARRKQSLKESFSDAAYHRSVARFVKLHSTDEFDLPHILVSREQEMMLVCADPWPLMLSTSRRNGDFICPNWYTFYAGYNQLSSTKARLLELQDLQELIFRAIYHEEITFVEWTPPVSSH